MKYFEKLQSTLPKALLTDYGNQIIEMCIMMERHGWKYLYGGSFESNLEILVCKIRNTFPAYAEKYNF